jgi:phospholipid transport system substrate-binding protein
MRIHKFFCQFAMATLLVMTAGGAMAAEPLAQIRSTVEDVLALLRNKTLSHEEQRRQLREVVRPAFDFEVMAQWVLGTNWRNASVAERQRFIDLFSDLLEQTYIGKIRGYNDERVEYIGEKVAGQKAEVETLVKTHSADIPIRYKLFRKGELWLVYDVVIEEVSLVRNYRSSYGEIVRKDGFPGLFSRMEEKIRELKTPKAAS